MARAPMSLNFYKAHTSLIYYNIIFQILLHILVKL
nr:MAG TPA: hypothetical protein [Caudoviricetes sp.]